MIIHIYNIYNIYIYISISISIIYAPSVKLYGLSNSLAPPIVESSGRLSPLVCGYQWMIVGYGMVNTPKRIKFTRWYVTWWLTPASKWVITPQQKWGQYKMYKVIVRLELGL